MLLPVLRGSRKEKCCWHKLMVVMIEIKVLDRT